MPLLRRPDGTTVELGTHGPLVGVLAEPVYSSFEHVLGDDVVILFTDGVVEARWDGELFGLERLVELVQVTSGDVSAITQAIVDAALEFQHGNPRDDIAVVTLQGEPSRSPADTLPA